jgi:prepilin-type N-terminal cleavage/methylation domain-containing protein
MVTRTHHHEEGVSLIEMLVVVAILGVALASIFAAVQVLTRSAGSNSANSAGTDDLSYTMELLSKTLMGSRVLYADDDRIVVLRQLGDGGFEVDSVYAIAAPVASSGSGNLVWERWSSDASGTTPVGNAHNVWVMSTSNANLAATPAVPLFAYYKDATDASLMSAAAGDKGATPDSSVSAFTGVLPAGYTVSAVRRIRLHIVASFDTGVRDDSRDITLRVRS